MRNEADILYDAEIAGVGHKLHISGQRRELFGYHFRALLAVEAVLIIGIEQTADIVETEAGKL